MKINIDTMTEADLVDLNNRIVQRIRFLRQAQAHSAMLEFRIGDRVEFQPYADRYVVGVLTRYNKKSVTVIADTGERWNVAPGLLRRVTEASPSRTVESSGLRLLER